MGDYTSSLCLSPSPLWVCLEHGGEEGGQGQRRCGALGEGGSWTLAAPLTRSGLVPPVGPPPQIYKAVRWGAANIRVLCFRPPSAFSGCVVCLDSGILGQRVLIWGAGGAGPRVSDTCEM